MAAAVDFDGLRVLVVDDHRDSAVSLVRLLETFGCRAEACFDGASAEPAARRLEPDLVILDIRLPDVAGTDVCRALQANDRLKDKLYVALTGASDDAVHERARTAGFHHVLTKPIRLESVLEVLTAAARR